MEQGMKKFVLRGMAQFETLEERVKRLKNARLPGIIGISLDLYCNDLKEECEACTARLEMLLGDNAHYRTVHARCASFREALDHIQDYQTRVIAGESTDDFEVSEYKKPWREPGEMENAPFETRAEFMTWTEVLNRHTRVDNTGAIDFMPPTVADLPELNHGMAVYVPLKDKEGNTHWIVDWFDHAALSRDGKSVHFVCIHDSHADIYPLDPYIGDSINNDRPIPKAYKLWLTQTKRELKKELNSK